MTRVNGENLSIYFALFLVCMEIYWNNVFLSHITSGSDRLINCRDIQYIFSCNHNSTTYCLSYTPPNFLLTSTVDSRLSVEDSSEYFIKWIFWIEISSVNLCRFLHLSTIAKTESLPLNTLTNNQTKHNPITTAVHQFFLVEAKIPRGNRPTLIGCQSLYQYLYFDKILLITPPWQLFRLIKT